MLESTFNQTETKQLLSNNTSYNELTIDGLSNNTSIATDVFFKVGLFYDKDGINNATQWLAVCLLIQTALTTGLSLDYDSFKEHLKQPILFLLPACIQFLLMPMIALAWIRVFGVSYTPVIAILVLASLPGGLSSYVLASLIKGDQPLSGSISFVFAPLSFCFLPFNLYVYTSHWLLGHSPSRDDTIAYPRIIFTFLLLMIPICVGAFAAKLNPKVMGVMNKIVQILLALTALCLCSLTILTFGKDLFVFMSDALWVFCGIFPLIGWTFGIIATYIFRFIAITRRTVAVETMSLNGALACGILRLLFPVNVIRIYVIFPFVYSIIQFLETMLYIALVRYKLKKEEEKKENAFFALGGVRVNRVQRISLHAIDKFRRSFTRSKSSDVSDPASEPRHDDDNDQDVFMTSSQRNNLMKIAITEEEESTSSLKRKSSGSKKKSRTTSLQTSSSMSCSRFEDVDISKSD